jgi:hypothetical protein
MSFLFTGIVNACQFRFPYLPVRQIGMKVTLEEFAVTWHEEMHQFVNDGVLAEVAGERKQLGVEGEPATRGKRGPFAAHRADLHERGLNVHAGRPMADGPAQVFFVVPSHMVGRSGSHTRCKFKRAFAAWMIFALPTIGSSALYSSARSWLCCCLFHL